MSDSMARIVRTLVQLVAGGGLTLLFDQLAKDVPTRWTPYVVLGATLLVTICQNLVEQWRGAGILRPASPPAPATVQTVAPVSQP